MTTGADSDPTRVVQGVVTGIGFLCAGVIMRDGLSIHGLNTAASTCAVAAVGVLLGVGFYGAALMLAVLSALSMSALRRLEVRLPGRSVLHVQLKFRTDTHRTSASAPGDDSAEEWRTDRRRQGRTCATPASRRSPS